MSTSSTAGYRSGPHRPFGSTRPKKITNAAYFLEVAFAESQTTWEAIGKILHVDAVSKFTHLPHSGAFGSDFGIMSAGSWMCPGWAVRDLRRSLAVFTSVRDRRLPCRRVATTSMGVGLTSALRSGIKGQTLATAFIGVTTSQETELFRLLDGGNYGLDKSFHSQGAPLQSKTRMSNENAIFQHINEGFIGKWTP